MIASLDEIVYSFKKVQLLENPSEFNLFSFQLSRMELIEEKILAASVIVILSLVFGFLPQILSRK